MVRLALIISVSLVAGCGAQVSQGPDEFGVAPSRPLEQPATFSALPQPIPGAANRADIDPAADAAAALGGRLSGGGIPASDAAIVTFAGRFGTDPGIRGDLAQADARYRNRRARLGLFGGGGSGSEAGYFRAYAPQTLNAYRELERFRASGVQVPTAPPAR
ncbi:MAG: DUF3035 domain-containing protein [Pseudomonadota bacterium]